MDINPRISGPLLRQICSYCDHGFVVGAHRALGEPGRQDSSRLSPQRITASGGEQTSRGELAQFRKRPDEDASPVLLVERFLCQAGAPYDNELVSEENPLEDWSEFASEFCLVLRGPATVSRAHIAEEWQPPCGMREFVQWLRVHGVECSMVCPTYT